MLRTTRSAILSLVLVLLVAGFARGETLGEIIRAVEEKSRSMKDMSCDMKMHMDVMKQKMSAEGEMKMLLPDKFMMSLRMKMPDMNMNMDMKMVSDGQVMYQDIETGDRRMVNRIDVKAAGIKMNMGTLPGMGGPGVGMTPSAAQCLRELETMMDVEQKADVVLDDGQSAWVIEGKFKPAAFRMMEGPAKLRQQGLDAFKSQMAGMRLYIGKRDKYLNRMEFLAGTGETVGGMEFSNLKINSGLTAADFTYAPPEGVTVNDMTEMFRAFQAGTVKPEAGTEAEPAPAPDGPPSNVLKVGVPAPAFTVKTLSGTTIDLAAFRGKPVVVFFWATWHKGSVGLLAEMDALAKTYRAQGLTVVALSLDEPGAQEDVKRAVAEKGVTVDAAIGNDTIFDASEIPSYVLMDTEGKVLSSEAKPKDLSELAKTLDSLLKKTDGKVVKK